MLGSLPMPFPLEIFSSLVSARKRVYELAGTPGVKQEDLHKAAMALERLKLHGQEAISMTFEAYSRHSQVLKHGMDTFSRINMPS